MYAHACITAVALVVAPVSVTPRDSEEQALDLYDQGAYLDAAAVAIGGYVSPAEPPARRLRNARLAQEAFSRAYETTAASVRLEYLCRALDVLDATAVLAVEDADVQLHKTLADTHTRTLRTRHPGHVCEVGTELRPLRAIPRTPAPAGPVTPPASTHPDAAAAPREAAPAGRGQVAAMPLSTREIPPNRAPAALKITGAVTMSLGVAALAAMVGGLAIRSRAFKALGPLDAAQMQHGMFSTSEGRELAALTATADAGRQAALAGGISGAVLWVLGATLVGRGHALTKRTRLSPIAGLGRAGLVVEGCF